jgi:hypothetical protein
MIWAQMRSPVDVLCHQYQGAGAAGALLVINISASALKGNCIG